MAQRVIRVDDLDQSEGALPVTLMLNGGAFDGLVRDIDLTEANIEKLREALAPFWAVARARPKGAQAKKTSIDKAQLDAIRRWAHAHGYEFSDRGRIPGNIVEAYQKEAGRAPARQKQAEAAEPDSRGLFSESH